MKYLILIVMFFSIGCSSSSKKTECDNCSFKEEIDRQHSVLDSLNRELKEDTEIEALSEDGKCSQEDGEEEKEGLRCNYEFPHDQPHEPEPLFEPMDRDSIHPVPDERIFPE